MQYLSKCFNVIFVIIMPSDLNDVERGKPDEKEPLLRDDNETKTRKLDRYSIEELGAVGSLPTYLSSTDSNHATSPGSEPPADIASPQVDGQKELNNRLLSALYKHTVDNAAIQKLLEEGADPNAMCTDHGGDVYACSIAGMFDKKKLESMKVEELAMEADKVAAVSENWTPLHIAAYFIHLETMHLLLTAHAKPNICDDKGRTPLDVTGLATNVPKQKIDNFTDVLKLLIAAGGPQNTMIKDLVKKHQTPLHVAVELDNLDAVKLLLSHGALAGCWNKDGVTPLHLCAKMPKPNKDIWMALLAKEPDVEDSRERTPLRAAIEAGWLEGVRLALRSGADVTLPAEDGETPLHILAVDKAGCFDIRDDDDENEKSLQDEVLNEIISAATEKEAIDCLNRKGATALFLAVEHGKYLIVEKLLRKGASIKHTVETQNVLHIAAKEGHASVLGMLLDFDENSKKLMVNSLSRLQGYGPIHFAVAGNHLSCVDVLKLRGADLCLKTENINPGISEISHPKDATPLHIAAASGNLDIATSIMRHYDHINRKSENPLKERDGNGWCPLHTAITKSNVNIIKYFVLEQNDSLVSPTRSEKPETAIGMIIQHVTNPTDFLEEVLDSCISYNLPNEVQISYRVLMPNSSDLRPRQSLKEEMDVIEQLLKTGDEFNQKRLLLHPLIESFIHLKWQPMIPYYLLIALLYIVFLGLLIDFVVVAFYDKDVSKTKPKLVMMIVWTFITYFFILMIVLQELLMNFEGPHYFCKWRTWIKLGSLLPALIVPLAMMLASETAEWPRHVSSLALFLVCFHMMNLLSQFPRLGYYVVMFKKVAFNVFKILATFFALLVCFAFSFKIQFRSQYPFDGSWDAIVKTLFMLSAEFEYNDVFDPKKTDAVGSAFEVVRIILLAFLVFAAIVLMNMMVGVAVDDINELKSHGKIGLLEKQAHFVRSFDRLNSNIWNSFLRCIMLPSYQRRKFPAKIIIAGDILKQKPDYEYKIKGLPKRIKDAFYSIAEKNKEKKDVETSKDKELKTQNDKKKFIEDTIQRLDYLEASMTRMRCDLNTKVDLIIRKLERLEGIQ